MALGDAALEWMLVPNCIPLLYLRSRDRLLRLANLGGNVEVWLPQGAELPALRYLCLEISPDLGAESGEGSVALLKLSLLGFLDRWGCRQSWLVEEWFLAWSIVLQIA